jgi:hypothetical protein
VAGAVLAVLLVAALAVGYWSQAPNVPPDGKATVDPDPEAAPAIKASLGVTGVVGVLYGRITTIDGVIYEGWMRWGGTEEALWGNYFNGYKDENPWIAYLPSDLLKERRPIKIFGVQIAQREREVDFGRPFMVRFGDIDRIEGRGVTVRVILKSGTAFDLDRLNAGDFDDGLRVWDAQRGVVDLDSLQIRTVQFLPVAESTVAPSPLFGTVHTSAGDFTGFVQWNRRKCLGSDTLDGRTTDGEVSLRFGTLRSIQRPSRDRSLVTSLDGREVVLSGTPEVGEGNRGLYVDDPRYGRVLVSWDVFQRLDFGSVGGGAPTYGDFPPGGPLTGRVTNRAGDQWEGRLVYDLDESETAETLDAPSQGVDYTIPFGWIASIVLPSRDTEGDHRAMVSLQNGEELRLDAAGDLGPGNAGLLIFVDDRRQPEYVPWPDVARIDFDRPL